MNDEQGILRRLDHYADCIEKGVHVTGTQLKSLVKDIRESGLISSQQPAAVDGAMVERAWEAAMEIKHNKEPWFPMTKRRMKRALTAALAAQQGGDL